VNSPDFLTLPDLAARPAGGSVVWPNDDLLATIVEAAINGDTRNQFEVNPTRR
jgi:hypothetical protein